jgi:hypothetical protein
MVDVRGPLLLLLNPEFPMPPRLLLAALLVAPATLAAQFDVGLRLIDSRSSAHAAAPGVDDTPTMLPSPALGGAVDLGLRRGAWRFAVSAARSDHDLLIVGDAAGVITPGVLRATAFTLRAGRSLYRHDGLDLSWAVGATGLRWSFPGLTEAPRWRWGPVAVLEASSALNRHWTLVSQFAASRSQGVFDDAELPEGYQRSSATRVEWSVGLRIGPGR